MSMFPAEKLPAVRVGLLLALLTLVFGFGLGGAFGAFEHGIKNHLERKALSVVDQRYGGDEDAAHKTSAKSWVYFKRAHLHANGLGAAALAMILLLALLGGSDRVNGLTAAGLGVGSLGYSLFWLWAGIRAPALGGTGAAKESLQWLAVPSAGLCLLGLFAVVGILIAWVFQR